MLYFISPIGDGGHGYGVTEVGYGSLVYDGTNTYTGTTDVTGGRARPE